MTERALLDSGQVAAWLAMSRDSFCRKWRGLVAEHGFPPPVPGCGLHWDPHAIERWLDRQIPEHLHETRIEVAPPNYAAELRANIPAALGVVEEA